MKLPVHRYINVQYSENDYIHYFVLKYTLYNLASYFDANFQSKLTTEAFLIKYISDINWLSLI